jgi:replication-associated recombination protein RarA
MALTQLIYASRPFGFDDAMLNGILLDARRNNPLHEVTGALICRADIYLQLIEGPQAAIEGLFQRIEVDNRHLEVMELRRTPVTDRLFPAWAMRDDPARSWMWTQKEVAEGAAERATPDQALAIFTRLAATPSH